MSGIYYKAEAIFVGTLNTSIHRSSPVTSFSVSGGSFPKGINLTSTNDSSLLMGLEDAKSKRNITLFKFPSKDDLDSLLAGLFSSRDQFGLNLDIYVNYTGSKSWIQIVHFLGEDSTVSSLPTRQGAGRNVAIKVDFAFPKAYFKRGDRQNGKWVIDEQSYPF